MFARSLLILTAAGGLAGCHLFMRHPPTPAERTEQFIHCFREEFDPTDEQLALLRDKVLKPDDSDRSAAAELKTATDQLEKGLESDTPEGELMADFAKVSRLKDQMSETHFKKMLALRSILTSKQRSKFLVCKRKMGPAVLPHEG